VKPQALYSLPQIARLMGASNDTARRLVDRLGIETVAVGEKRYVPLSELVRTCPQFVRSLTVLAAMGIEPPQSDDD
jgi:excisionase family DNA binding protein